MIMPSEPSEANTTRCVITPNKKKRKIQIKIYIGYLCLRVCVNHAEKLGVFHQKFYGYENVCCGCHIILSHFS